MRSERSTTGKTEILIKVATTALIVVLLISNLFFALRVRSLEQRARPAPEFKFGVECETESRQKRVQKFIDILDILKDETASDEARDERAAWDRIKKRLGRDPGKE